MTYNSGRAPYSAIAADSNNNIHVVWEDSSPGSVEIYYNGSADGGITWKTERLTYNSGDSESPAIAVDSNDHMHVVWNDDTPGNSEIYHNYKVKNEFHCSYR